MPYKLTSKGCQECGREFLSRKPSNRWCSHKCAAVAREKLRPATGAPKRTYPVELVEKVRLAYESGLSMEETALSCGTTRKVLHRLMPRNGIAVRSSAEVVRPTGAGSHGWRGDAAGYKAMHLRVAKERGKPSWCSQCERTDDEVRYEWANLSGRYEDVQDYARMCVPCHRRFDAARRGGGRVAS